MQHLKHLPTTHPNPLCTIHQTRQLTWRTRDQIVNFPKEVQAMKFKCDGKNWSKQTHRECRKLRWRRRRENRTHTACHSWRMSSDWATAGDEELDYEDKRIWRGASSGSGGGAPEQHVEWGVARPPALPPIIARWVTIDATYMTPSCLNTP